MLYHRVVLLADRSEKKCQDAYTECDPNSLADYWKPNHYKYHDYLKAQAQEQRHKQVLPYTSPAWNGLPLVTGAADPLLSLEVEMLAQQLCNREDWLELLEAAQDYENSHPVKV